MANKTSNDISGADRRKETEKLDKRDAALSDDKLLEKKKTQFTEALNSIAEAVKEIREAIAKLKLPPTPEINMKEADAAREKLAGAVAAR